MNYVELFKRSVLLRPDTAALVDREGARTTSYAELDRLSGRVAGKLAQTGCRPGDFVMLRMDRRMEYWAAYLGAFKAGCVVVPVMPDYPEERVAFIRDDCRAALTVTEDFFENIDAFSPVERPADGPEPAMLAYTSGSTGTPKGILFSAGDLARAARRQHVLFEGVSPLVLGGTTPFAFLVHTIEYLTVFSLGGTVHILPDHIRRSTDGMADYFEEHGVTAAWIIPQMLRGFKPHSKTFQCALSGGERMSQVSPDGFTVRNCYGMSEMAGIACMFPVDRPYDNTPIGKALPTLELSVCDANGKPLPSGQEGEICVKGPFDVRYFHDPKRSEQLIRRTADGETILHSGDVGYINENGDLVYTNRRDWMVKINGQRVDTMEIEVLLLNLPQVQNAAVKAFTDEDSHTYLAAYVVADRAITDAELRERLSRKLPDYMLPRFFVRMAALPKNANGKLDRGALLPPSAELYKAAFVAPENETEAAICRGFEAVLHCGAVGAADDFFALGGDSIKTLRLIDAVGLDTLTPDKILTGKTPRGIAALCEKAGASRLTHEEVVPSVCPMTESQKGVYLECAEAPDSTMYNIPMLCRLPKDTDIGKLADAIRAVAAVHPALQITVGTPDGVPSMIFHGDCPVTVTETKTDDLARKCRDFVRPFDLEAGPLCRFELCRHPEGVAFLFDVHHLIFDGTSSEAFVSQVAQVYGGGEAVPEALTVFDVSRAEESFLGSAEHRAAQDFFQSKFDGAETDGKPVSDRVTEDFEPGAGRVILSADGRFDAQDVAAFIQSRKISENTLFLGAFAYALAKFNGAAESTFCTVNNGRHDPRLAGSIGMFVRTMPLTYTVDEAATVDAFLPSVQDDFYRTMRHDGIPFGELAAKYGVNTDVVFVYQAELFNGAAMDGEAVTVEPLETGDAQSDLDVMLLKTAHGYEVMAHFKKSMYSEALVRSFASLYLNVIRGMLTAHTLGDIALTDAESEAVMDAFNRTEYPYDATKTIVDRFREQAARTPQATCLCFRDKTYTFGEVDELTDRLARHLVRGGVGAEKVVGVLIPRNEYMLIASLGVLKAGGAYLPLDASYPPERLNLMMRDSGAKWLITTPELSPIIDAGFVGVRMMTDEIPALPESDTPLPTPRPEDLFVMLYTSGSTGVPKGVMFEHKNALVSGEFFIHYLSLDSTCKTASYASYGFDAHVTDLYPTIMAGGELHIIAEDIRLDLLAVRDYFNEHGITHVVMTTQVGRQFAELGGMPSLRHVSVGGEKLTPFDPPKDFCFNNMYGPTEGSVLSSAFRLDRRYRDIPIGPPTDNLKAYVVDKAGKRLPIGAVGELWISGTHVTRGYLNRPEKTAEAYGDNPFSRDPEYSRVYRTGDIVRLMGDGNLQFIGRRDAQVKVRGFRIELTEVEEVIRRFPGIADATVAAFDEPSGGKYIAAYVVSDQAVDVEALNDFIRAEKPPYMVPAVTMQIDRIPLTQNQKVNKKALPLPERKAANIVPPENETQQKIFDIVADVIGHREFGILTELYEAGLTSIGSVKLNVALAQAFDVPIRLADIKANDTVKKLEAFLAAAAPTTAYERQADYPLTQTQNGIFIECMAAPDTTIYNIPMLIRLPGKRLSAAKLAAAVASAIDAHPYIKMTLFTDDGGNVRARRNDEAPADVAVIPCEQPPVPTALVRPYTLLDAPLYRAAVYETPDDLYLFMDFHHILSDGSSEAILLADIEKAYAGETPAAEEYTGFEAALEEEAARKTDRYDAAKAYYDGIFAGCDADCLPQKSPESEVDTSATLTRACTLRSDAVEAYCREHKLTPNAFFNAVFGFVLAQFDRRDEVIYTTVYNGRSDSRLARSVTMLVKTVPVLTRVDGNAAPADLVRDVQTQLMDSFSHDLYSFAEISHAYGIKADLIFVYQDDGFAPESLCGAPAEMLDAAPNTAKAPITVNVFKRGDTYELIAEYRQNRFGAALIGTFLDALEQAAVGFTQSDRLQAVSLLSAPSRAVIDRANDTDRAFENVPVHRLFERFADKTPDKAAVFAGDEQLTFRQLNERANRIAHALHALGIRENDIVGMMLDRTADIPAVELGVLKAGGAFLGLLPDYPDERIEFCLTNADSPVVITTKAIRDSRPELFAVGHPYRVKTVEELLETEQTENLNLDIDVRSLAYCIYTSGSTGTPKGVMIEHHNLANHVQTAGFPYAHYAGERSDAVGLAMSSVTFDMSIFDLLLHLLNGQAVCIASEEEIHNPTLLAARMVERKVDTMACTPSFINNYVGMPEFRDAIAGLKCIVVGAEAFPGTLYTALKDIRPDMNILNGYGPTECTISCCAKSLTGPHHITIGSPMANTHFYVIDRFGNILPPYACGELIIGGECVGRGYVKLPEKNKAAFFEMEGVPAYHSGDLVRMNEDGEIEFCGRIDNQVKLRGFRVELDEIENVMVSFDAVKQSKVIVRNNGSEDYLAGFFTADGSVDIDKLTAYLKSKLTYYMVPDVLMQLDTMPLTPSGKIDKKALPDVKKTAKKSGRRAPKKSLEQRLCEIFASVLGQEEVFADDNFFELGGTSLSASKVTMMLMSDGIDIQYGDIFDHPTPEELSAFIEEKTDAEKAAPAPAAVPERAEPRPALQWNRVKYAAEVKREPLGNVLLTGAGGFLGIHVLRELLDIEDGHIWCLVRRGNHETAEIRLKTMLVYYFSKGFEEELRDRISVVEADITDDTLADKLADVPFDTVINCAACVKHFSDNDILERINVHGVENLIALCRDRRARLVQVSTVSVPGIHTPESYERQVRMHEDELFVIDDMANKYGISKYQAELRILDAIEQDGLRGKIVRVGNLMGRHSDGEFQANLETNMFISGIRGFTVMGKYPISHMTDPMRFSPVDCTARAVVMLAGTNDKFTAFNADNRYGFDEMKIIDACNRNGIPIVPTDDDAYYAEFQRKLGDDRVNATLNGLAAYDIQDAHAVETDNRFTTNILYRIGFSWPLVDDTYLDRAIHSIMTLDYFNVDETDEMV